MIPPAEAVSVSPSRVAIQAKPGESRAGVFTVTNDGAVPITVRVEPEDWSQGLDGPRGAVPWLTVRPTILTLGARRSAKVRYTVRVPRAAQGELRAQVFFTSEVRGASMPMRSRLGTIVYVGIEGTIALEGVITKVDAAYTASTPGVPKPDRLEFRIGLHNRGNAHIAPDGVIVVQDESGQTVATVPLQGGWGLLPNEEEAYHAVGHGIYLPPGPYTLRVNITYGSDLGQSATVTKILECLIAPDARVSLSEPAPPAP